MSAEKRCQTSPLNAYYGHEAILQEFCDVPYDLPASGQIQHGWVPPGYPTVQGHNPDFCVGHLWTEADIREDQPHYTVIGSPYLYLSDPCCVLVSAGLLAIPSHGIHPGPFPCGAWNDYAGWLAEEAKRLETAATVCLYPSDYAGAYEAFASYGIRIVSASPKGISVPGFLYRIRSFIRQHMFVTTNRIGSAAFYAAYEGKEVTINGPLMMTDPPDIGEELIGDKKFLCENFREFLPGSIDLAAQHYRARKILGLRYKKTPGELRSLLWNWYYDEA